MRKKQIATTIDKLGKLKAKISELKKEEDSLREALLKAGAGEYEGALFRACIFESERKVIDWTEIVKACKVPKAVIEKNTTCVEYTSLRLSAKPT
jgi:hypothetical protein